MCIFNPRALRRFVGFLAACFFAQHASVGAYAGISLKVSSIYTQPLTIVKGYNTNTNKVLNLDKAEGFLARCDVTLDLVVMPSWSRAYELALTGKVDALMPTNHSKAREQDFFFPRQAFASMAVVVFSHKDSSVSRYSGPEVLAGKRLGRLSGTLLTKEIDDYVEANNVINVERSTIESLFEALVQRDIDFAADQMVLDTEDLAALEIDTWVKPLMPPAGETPLYIALSKKGKLAAPENAATLDCLLQ